MKTADNSKMGEYFFKYLPSKILVEILSRLPTRAAMACKCVCKSWFGLLATPEFVNSHIYRSVPGLLVKNIQQARMMSMNLWMNLASTLIRSIVGM